MKHELIPLTDEERWCRALDGMATPLAHSHAYCKALSLSVEYELFLYRCDGDGGKAVCPLGVRRLSATAPPELFSPYGSGGFVTTWPSNKGHSFFAEWTDFCRREGFATAYIVQNPAIELPTDMVHEFEEQPQVVYLLDLTPPLKDMFSSLNKTHRYEIRKVDRDHTVTIAHSTPVLHEAFLELYPQTMQRVGASDCYDFSRETLKAFLEIPEMVPVGVIVGGKVEAVSLFILPEGNGRGDCNVMEYFLSASTSAGRKYSRNIIWNALEMQKKRGAGLLNLGGGVAPGDGLDRFKQRFNAVPCNLKALKQVVLSTEYKQLCLSAGVDSNSQDGYFPPYWKNRKSSTR
ncbi:hypothetical protein [Desulfovibrio oxyclinae]|uniref:hypothetical protein n=1 Tax=Desulfovibrio oxyclinae TaxID=63560 RepID=UPI00039CDB27|nr:hypothetical protein [Desulfovibrio oxyclinae]